MNDCAAVYGCRQEASLRHGKDPEVKTRIYRVYKQVRETALAITKTLAKLCERRSESPNALADLTFAQRCIPEDNTRASRRF